MCRLFLVLPREILFGNERYGIVRELTVREILGPGMDGTGNFSYMNRLYGKFWVREWTVREIFRTGMDGTGSPGIPVPWQH
jgi:hypothetical protein